MPELRFRVRWPDQSVTDCYSPSRIVQDYLVPGQSYSVSDFVSRSRKALVKAGERVREKYGYGCGQAALQLEEIQAIAARFRPRQQVLVEAFHTRPWGLQ